MNAASVLVELTAYDWHRLLKLMEFCGTFNEKQLHENSGIQRVEVERIYRLIAKQLSGEEILVTNG